MPQVYNYQMSIKEKQQKKLVSKRLWTGQEDQLLKAIVQQNKNTKWSIIAGVFNKQLSGLSQCCRTNKQCRQRWQNHLNPILHNSAQWSEEQLQQLFNLFKEYPHQWSIINCKLGEKGFNKRGDNNIKNNFYANIKKIIKKINLVIHKNNNQNKQKKRILFNYNEKYAYKKKLSLQRQILINQKNIGSFIFEQDAHPDDSNVVINIQSSPPEIINIQTSNKSAQLRIIKELNQQIINKILLITDSRGHKFIIHNKKYISDAERTRNKLFDLILFETTFSDEDVVKLAIQILEISKKCKKKNYKNYNETQRRQAGINDQIIYESQVKDQQDSESQDQIPQNQGKDHTQLDNMTINPKNIHSMKQKKDVSFNSRKYNNQNDFNPERNIWMGNNQIQEEKSSNQISFIQKSRNFDENPNQYLIDNCFQKSQLEIDIFNPSSNHQFNAHHLFSSGLRQIDFSREYHTFNHHVHGHDLSINQYIMSDRVQKQNNLTAKEPEINTIFAGFNFINSIKEVKPEIKPVNSIANLEELDFQFDEINRNDIDEGKVFSSQLFVLKKRQMSRRSNRSKSKTNKISIGDQDNKLCFFDSLLQSQNLMNRSWAYTDNRNDYRNSLFNSNNYEINKSREIKLNLDESHCLPRNQN